MKQIKFENISDEDFIRKNATKDALYEIVMRVVRENVKLREEVQHLKEYIEIIWKDVNKEEEKPKEMIIHRYKGTPFNP